MFVKKDGTIYFFCSMKCHKNLLKMGRIPRNVRWTGFYTRAKHGVAEIKEVVEEMPVEEAPVVEAEIATDFNIQAPKGKDIPQAIVTLIDKRFGPDLSLNQVEKNFFEFTASENLRHTLGLWFRKRYPTKKLTKIVSAEYVAFLETNPAKKLLKDWLDEKAKKEGKK